MKISGPLQLPTLPRAKVFIMALHTEFLDALEGSGTNLVLGAHETEGVVPALAGFQSEHEVEIPFMLTTRRIAKVAARGSKRPRIDGVWDYSSNWKCSGEGFS